jgi:hypothetical protein
LSVDGRRLALTSSDGIYLYILNGGPASAASVTPMFFLFPDDTMEGGTFFREGFLATNERGAVWGFKEPSFVCRGPARLEEPLLPNPTVPVGMPVHFEAKAAGCPAPQFAWFFNGQPIPGATNSFLDLPPISPSDAGAYDVAAFNRYGGQTNRGILNVVVRGLDVRITEVMSSPADDPTVKKADWFEITNFEQGTIKLKGWRFNDSAGFLSDAYVITNDIELEFGRSLILVENLTPAEFIAWWGENNIPLDTPIITYGGPGLSFRADPGDTIYLWDDVAANPEDFVTRADFGVAAPGVSFIMDPFTELFPVNADLSIPGVVRAESSSDIGSPGKL